MELTRSGAHLRPLRSLMADIPLSPESTYRQRCAEFGALRDRYEQRSNRNGNLNVLLVLVSLVCLALASLWSEPLLYGTAGVFALAFVVSFIHHDRVKRQLQRYSTLYALNEEGLHRRQRTWGHLPLPALLAPGTQSMAGAASSPSHVHLDPNTAADLDLLGRASLAHLLATPNTPVGQATLGRWILGAAAPEIVYRRQSAVAELAPQIDFRDDVALRGRLMGPAQTHYEGFMAWAEGPGWLHQRPWLIWLARGLALLVLGLGLAQWRGLSVYPALVAVLLANLVLIALYGHWITEEINRVAARQRVFQAYAEMFERFTAQTFTSPGLRHLQEQLNTGDLAADRQMRRLARLMPLADIRRWMFFFFIEWPTLWSVHLLWLLERWQRDAGGYVRTWLETLGEAEALIALATLHHDHPNWAFPELTTNEPRLLTAQDLAHPLLPPGRAVGNDVAVGPPGTVLLVTGSNMSGKSTLLRALGVNTILAQMGGPVCARQMRLPPLTVASSMRVQDSLEQGVSHFMAELRRLKAIVDLAAARQDHPERLVLYLLDEILQGTNTYERQIAARRVILHLAGTGAIGAVSTHDLTLADTPEMAAVSVPVHFTETFTRTPEGPTMTFDYQLRPGIATSTNALKLMELVGLPLAE